MVIILALAVVVSAVLMARRSHEIKIGAILPLTGDNAQWGIAPLRGAQLAIDQINDAGGVKGKRLVLLPEDDQCQPTVGVSAFRKLLSVSGVKIIMGAVCSSVTLAVAPLAQANKIILFSPASTNPALSQAGDYFFRDIPSDSYRGKVFAEYLYNDLKIKSVAILYINNDGGVGNRDAFANRFTELGGIIVANESYQQDATDMRSQISKIKDSKAQALVVVSYLADTPLVLRQCKELGLKLPLFFQTEAVQDPQVLRAAGNAANGVTYILPAQAEGTAPERFKRMYVEKYGTAPELFAAEAFDAINLIAKAIDSTEQNASSVNTGLIKDFLHNVKDYQGASGVITFDKDGNVLKPMAIKVIRNGVPILLETK